MARVRLEIRDETLALTVRALLRAAGHDTDVVEPQVVITDALRNAVETGGGLPVLVLASSSHIAEAVAAMREGVYGYIFLPLQPGEADLMVRRAAREQRTDGTGEVEPVTLAEAERRHILSVLRHCSHNHSRAARLLGIGRNTLWRKLKAFALEGGGRTR